MLRHARPPNPRRRRRALELKSAAVDVSTPRIPPARDEADRPNGGSTGRPSGVAAAPRRPTALGRRRCPSAPLRSGGEVGRHVSVSGPAADTGPNGAGPNHHHTEPARHRLGRRRGWTIAEARSHRAAAALAFCASGTRGTTGRSRSSSCERPRRRRWPSRWRPARTRRIDVAHAPQMSLSRRTRRCGRVLGLGHGVEQGDCGDRERRGARARQPRVGVSARPRECRSETAGRTLVGGWCRSLGPQFGRRGRNVDPRGSTGVGFDAAATATRTRAWEFFYRAPALRDAGIGGWAARRAQNQREPRRSKGPAQGSARI